MDTCLFTGEMLGAQTHWEHTIPKKLAGRIRSKRVSSDAFNSRCSRGFDEPLVNSYVGVLKFLQPLLATEHGLGVRYAIGRDGHRARVGAGGTVELGKARVERDARRRPVCIHAANEREARELAVRQGVDLRGASVEFRSMAEDDGTMESEDEVELCWQVELAALKAAMLSFDEKLADDLPRRFTRDPSLDRIREFVRTAVLEGAFDDGAYAEHVMGLQYDKMPEIELVRSEHGPRQRSEFEHVLVASGNTADGRLDLVWWIAGIDPFGFRLSHGWRDHDFTCLLVSGMLKGESCSGPIWVNHAHPICAPAPNCAIRTGDIEALARHEAMNRRRLERLSCAHQQAVYLKERRCDDHVAEELCRLAEVMGATPQPLGANAVLAESLGRLYAHRLNDPVGRARFLETVARTLPTGDAKVDPPRAAADLTCPATWLPLLPLYRQALEEVRALLGLPGHAVDRGHTIEPAATGSGPR